MEISVPYLGITQTQNITDLFLILSILNKFIFLRQIYFYVQYSHIFYIELYNTYYCSFHSWARKVKTAFRLNKPYGYYPEAAAPILANLAFSDISAEIALSRPTRGTLNYHVIKTTSTTCAGPGNCSPINSKNGLSNCYRITTNCVDLVTFKRTFLIKIILMIPSTGKSEKLKSSSYKDLKTAAKTSWFKILICSLQGRSSNIF